MEYKKISLLINSCGRLDLLDKTISSFYKFNTYPIDEVVLVDDSGNSAIHDMLIKKYPDFNFILKRHRGLIPCIDDGFQNCRNEWVFKLEDDWLFFKHGFIEKSMVLLEHHPIIQLVWLRERFDTNTHPVEKELFETDGVSYSFMRTNIDGWHGFTFNPSLWRMSDYKKLAPFIDIAGPEHLHMATKEMNIGQWYYNLGYRAVILSEGYCSHIGVYPGKYLP
jgi:glycosyltransferase involved in cell wall biosynthesis